ncbi:unnamed protein product [Trichogramma brassicae]|uniref:Tyrosinase copper-binding domain-containing protein n=1 Tax=Trichogramma brassicae TaxID=86971 RepID=A0A6H5IMA9_9HYME|nr:unnamed protein product [Trichogramma brassicae]
MDKKNLLELFDRPREPSFLHFDLPPNYVPESQYEASQSQAIATRFGDDEPKIQIKQVAIPDLSLPMSLDRDEAFSLFMPAHARMAARLTEIFMGARTIDDLLSLAAYCRDRINPQMFVYCLSVAILHRRDTKDLQLPQFSEIFPDKYVSGRTLSRAREVANTTTGVSRRPIDIPVDYTGTDADPEHRIAYWREDVGINLHHWHWHLIYPFTGPREVVVKDRRGELFYYMHHQIIARYARAFIYMYELSSKISLLHKISHDVVYRYNTERLANGLPLVEPLRGFFDPIPEAYFPKLDQGVAGRSFPGRPRNYVMSDIRRPELELNFNVADLEVYRRRFIDAIRRREVRRSDGSTVRLDEQNGIEILGNMLEASPVLSANSNFYGDLHNSLHAGIGLAHDPDGRYLENFSVLGDTATAMRDPAFYRIHQLVDDLLHLYKDSLPPYSLQELNFSGVQITDLRLSTVGSPLDTISTHWTKSLLEMSRGLDFAPREPVRVRVQHLNHVDFEYNFTVHNNIGRELVGTARIFIAPKYDQNRSRRFTFNEQRKLMIEMDKFTVPLKPGVNYLNRSSVLSSVTIPFDATFRDLDESRPDKDALQSFLDFNFCGCGWPQHMLAPKGNDRGFPMDLFVMISNYEFDRVDQPTPSGGSCNEGMSFCGLKNSKYPDARPMGYPFDRPANVQSVEEFVLPNMAVKEISVRFQNTVQPRQINHHELCFFTIFPAFFLRVSNTLRTWIFHRLQNRQRARGRRLGDPRPSEQLAAELCARGGLRPSARLRGLAAPETRRALPAQILAEFETRPSRRAGQQHGKTRRKLFELLSSLLLNVFRFNFKRFFVLQYLEVDLNATASSSEEENRVAYWREDVDINTHYWHLSLLYPDVENAALFGKKDRQGELFWYIHHQIIARYNAERLSNGLARVKPIKDFRQPIAEGYFSKLDATAYGRSYPGRPANQSLARIDRPREKLSLDVSDLELYRARILEVVHRHEVYSEVADEVIKKFDSETGVNYLGNILFYAKDNAYYGNLRGSLLHALAAIHDPESRHGEELGPLGDRATAMRDPAFYRVHALSDELVLAYKDSLPAYGDEELRLDDVICVGSRKGSLLKGTERHRERQIETRWSTSELDLSRGVSHAPKGTRIVASVRHLEHEDYELELQVLSVRSMATMATMRLFAAPSYDERRRRLTYDEQRKLMIELDKWVVKLDPGTNEIRRSSRLSSLTIPAENGAAADADDTPDVCQNIMEPCNYDSHDYCGSGWPRHALLPKGNEAGFVMDFFVMITDYAHDEVLDENRCDYCSRAGMRFCARPKAQYPDARPMGFPFDRRADEAHGIEYLDSFVSRYPNMWSEQITIKIKEEPNNLYDNENVDGENEDQASDTKNLHYFRCLHESARLIDAPIAACDICSVGTKRPLRDWVIRARHCTGTSNCETFDFVNRWSIRKLASVKANLRNIRSWPNINSYTIVSAGQRNNKKNLTNQRRMSRGYFACADTPSRVLASSNLLFLHFDRYIYIYNIDDAGNFCALYEPLEREARAEHEFRDIFILHPNSEASTCRDNLVRADITRPARKRRLNSRDQFDTWNPAEPRHWPRVFTEAVSAELKLRRLRDGINWEIQADRYRLLADLYPLIGCGENLERCRRVWCRFRDCFTPEQIELLLSDSALADHYFEDEGVRYIDLVTNSGHRDEPRLDQDGAPLSRRTTPIHHAAKQEHWDIVEALFSVYDRYDANYADERDGFTHFHAACMSGLYDVVEKFLACGLDLARLQQGATCETPFYYALRHGRTAVTDRLLQARGFDESSVGEDVCAVLRSFDRTNCHDELALIEKIMVFCNNLRSKEIELRDKSRNTPLHWAVVNCNWRVCKIMLENGERANAANDEGFTPLHLICKADQSTFSMSLIELLLHNGADENLANAEGSTALHLICKEQPTAAVVSFFELAYRMGRPLQVNARDFLGKTPLHIALAEGDKERTAAVLLRRGADPNLADTGNATPLHYACAGPRADEVVRVFFDTCAELHLIVLIDARDSSGQTPLQTAVAHCWPNAVGMLLRRRADMSTFEFPAASRFVAPPRDWYDGPMNATQLDPASRALVCAERLEQAGYALRRSDALTIMRLFVQTGLLERSVDADECEGFAPDAKLVRLNDSGTLTLYDLMRCSPQRAVNRITHTDYYAQLWRSGKMAGLANNHESIKILALHLCEKMSREFLRKWSIDSFWESIRGRLPMEMCDMIIKQLEYEDWCNIVSQLCT